MLKLIQKFTVVSIIILLSSYCSIASLPENEEPSSESRIFPISNLIEAANHGDANAQFNLGLRYNTGNDVTKDKKEAVKWFRKAADQGNAEAQNKMGWCCYHGSGIEQNASKAIEWYRLAALQGNTAAQYKLSRCYKDGQGVTKDPKEAAKWYALANKSTKKGYPKFEKKKSN